MEDSGQPRPDRKRHPGSVVRLAEFQTVDSNLYILDPDGMFSLALSLYCGGEIELTIDPSTPWPGT
jgi:hypothetical protein